MGKMLGYFYSPRIDSEQQLKDAQAAARSYTPKQDAQARAAGFKNADEMVSFLKQRQSGARVVRSGNPYEGMSISDLFAWHPSNTIQRASDALKGANSK